MALTPDSHPAPKGAHRMSTKQVLYTAGIAAAVVVLMQRFGHSAGLRHGA